MSLNVLLYNAVFVCIFSNLDAFPLNADIVASSDYPVISNNAAGSTPQQTNFISFPDSASTYSVGGRTQQGLSSPSNLFLNTFPNSATGATSSVSANPVTSSSSSSYSSFLPPQVVPNDFASSSSSYNSFLQPQVVPNNFASSSSSYSNFLPPQVVPNEFARASLAIPSIQRFLNLRIPGHKAAGILFRGISDRLAKMGIEAYHTIAHIAAHNVAEIDFFTIPLYFYARGNQIVNFLLSVGIENTPDLPQRYADYIEKALESTVINNNEDLLGAIFVGFSNFLDSLDYNIPGESYELSLFLSREFALLSNI